MDFGRRLGASDEHIPQWICKERATTPPAKRHAALRVAPNLARGFVARSVEYRCGYRSEEHTSELQSLTNLVCRLLLEKKKKKKKIKKIINRKTHISLSCTVKNIRVLTTSQIAK